MAERFFGSRKGERTALRHSATRPEARDDVVDYIEMCYNRTRFHSYLGYVSPNDYEGVAQVASLNVRFSLTTTIPLRQVLEQIEEALRRIVAPIPAKPIPTQVRVAEPGLSPRRQSLPRLHPP